MRRVSSIGLALLVLLGVAGPAAAAPATPGLLAERAALAAPAAGRLSTTPGPVAAASAIVPGSVDRTSLDLRATYDVRATLDYDRRALRVETTISVENTSGVEIDRLELNTVAARLGSMRRLSAAVDGTPVGPTLDDQTIVVPLGGVLAPGASAAVNVGYSATLRSGTSGSDWLFTRANGVVDLYRWIPWVSLRRPFSRPNHGDPFVTPVSPLVRVTIQASRPLVMATSGRLLWASTRTRAFEATDVRDFALTAAPDYRTSSRRVGDVFVQAFVRPGTSASARVDAAVRAIGRLTAKLGPFPVRTLLIAQSAGGFGMEAPGVIWIPGGMASSALPLLLAHESAHQWFYGSVGNDQALNPFVDEAAADFVARYVMGLRRVSRCSTGRLDLSIYRYSSACYHEIIYIQGGNLLDTARRAMGDTRFWAAMRRYLEANRLGIAGRRSLLDTLDDATSLDLAGRSFRSRFPSWY